jgi:OOP family OmpA-OmpF porin
MRKSLRPLVLAAALGVASGSAFAQGYIGGSIGQSDADFDCAGTISCDNKDTGFKLFGGYMFHPNFGVELAYADLGKATAVVPFGTARFNVGAEATAFGAYGIAMAPLSESFNVFAKLGVASVKGEFSVSGLGSDSETNTSFAYGVGAGFNFTKNLGLRAEWERFTAKFEGEEGDIDLLSLGVVFRF